MQAVESQTLILYHTELTGQWPADAARAFGATLSYARRVALGGQSAATRASLSGLALAARALGELLGRRVAGSEFVFWPGQKPHLAGGRAVTRDATEPPPGYGVRPGEKSPALSDFSISHSGPWVGCAALYRGQVGLDIEMGTEARIGEWVVREAALKASGEGLRALAEVAVPAPDAAQLELRGRSWHVRQLDIFPGARAALVTSRAIARVVTRQLAVGELFAA